MKYLTIIYVIISSLCISCIRSNNKETPLDEIEENYSGLLRYEDKDAICYTYYTHGVSCIKKDSK